MKTKQSGVTLLELLLVMLVAGSILVMGYRLYDTFQSDADVEIVKSNVDVIFQGMQSYYRKNCYGTTRSDQTVDPGTLNPAYVPASPPQLPIDIQTDLINTGYISTNIVKTSIVNPVGAGFDGYIAQFNKLTYDRQVCTDGPTGAGPTDCTVNVGKVTSWQAQVSVRLDKLTTAAQYLALLTGDCRSTLSGSTVLPCEVSGNTGGYIVFQRSVSSAVPKEGSTYWGTMPTVLQFKQMYTTYPITSLTSGTTTANQNYLCAN